MFNLVELKVSDHALLVARNVIDLVFGGITRGDRACSIALSRRALTFSSGGAVLRRTRDYLELDSC